MICSGMIDEVRPEVHADRMSSNLAGAVVALPVPEKIRTAEDWRQIGARLRKIDRDLYEAIFATIVAELVEPEPDMHESYLLV